MINNNQLYRDLLIKLPTSNGSIRKELAYRIYKEKGKLKDFSSLLYINELTANRFLWLLSDLAQLSPNIIKEYLPYLLSIKESIKSKTIESSFANLWLLVGVPLENEA